MNEFWLRCEKCGRSLSDSVSEAMQLVAVFKPSLLAVTVPRVHEKEHRHRCRQCGWVNLFVPVSAIPKERDRNPLLPESWRSITLKS